MVATLHFLILVNAVPLVAKACATNTEPVPNPQRSLEEETVQELEVPLKRMYVM